MVKKPRSRSSTEEVWHRWGLGNALGERDRLKQGFLQKIDGMYTQSLSQLGARAAASIGVTLRDGGLELPGVRLPPPSFSSPKSLRATALA